MSKRKSWTDAQPITGGDLTDIGIYSEEALGELALAIGSGRLNGLEVTQTPTASTQVIVEPGRALIYDPSVGRPRLATLVEPYQPNFTGRSSGEYAIIITATERDEDLRTIVPPPPSHPFFEPGLLAHDFSTGKRWVIGVSVQAMPYNPAGAQAILATVNWDGSSVSTAQIRRVLDYPTPLIADGTVLPSKLAPGLAGRGLSRASDGSLSVATDNSSIILTQDSSAQGATFKLAVADGGITDGHLGNRQMIQMEPPTNSTVSATPTALIRYLAGAISGITGKTQWNTKPDITLAELSTSITRRGANEIIAGNWRFNQPLSVADATLPEHAINKGAFDSAISSIANATANSVANHRSASVLDHPDGSVTDAKIGQRTVRPVETLPGTGAIVAGDITTLFGIMARAVRDIKGGTDWFAAPAINVSQISQRLSNLESKQGVINPNSITDGMIGPRTVDANQVITGDTASLTQILSSLANRIKEITGMGNWLAKPPTTLVELNANVSRKSKVETITAAWTFQAPVAVPDPTANNHAATMGWVNQTISTITGTNASSMNELLQGLNSKAPLNHTHSWSEITNKPKTLNEFVPEALKTEIGGFNPGRLPANEIAFAWVASRSLLLKGTGGRAIAFKSAASVTTLRIEVGGTSVGSITFGAGSTTGAISLNGDLTLNPGSTLVVRGPATMDMNLADIAITFPGVYL